MHVLDKDTRRIFTEALVMVLVSAVLALAAGYISIQIQATENREQNRRLDKIEEEHSQVLKTVADMARDVGYIRGRIEAQQ
jgi:hypothetical protein